MQEFTELLQDCLALYNGEKCDAQSCKLGLFCRGSGCDVGVCNSCMIHIQRHPSPKFPYSCKRITYHYVLRFFNRFASEIYYAMSRYKKEKLNTITNLNVVSLGCGPGSEVYGLIKAIRTRAPHIHMNYQGYDKNEIWEGVQQLSKAKLAQSGHSVEFYNKNLFLEFEGFQDNHIDLLVLNYLLSDCQKFYTTDLDRKKFIDELAFFVVFNNVRNILFNDNSFIGYIGKIDSGVKMMGLLIKSIRKWQQKVLLMGCYFSSDNYVPTTNWKCQPNGSLVFSGISGHNLDDGIRRCQSKQILAYIEP